MVSAALLDNILTRRLLTVVWHWCLAFFGSHFFTNIFKAGKIANKNQKEANRADSKLHFDSNVLFEQDPVPCFKLDLLCSKIN